MTIWTYVYTSDIKTWVNLKNNMLTERRYKKHTIYAFTYKKIQEVKTVSGYL